jgi:glyoxylase I family protein
MAFACLPAGIAVADIDVASRRYELLFGRAPDNRPMDTPAEWNVAGSGCVQVFVYPERAGATLLNFAVDDLTDTTAVLGRRWLVADPVQLANIWIELASLTDPDGNTIARIGSLRIVDDARRDAALVGARHTSCVCLAPALGWAVPSDSARASRRRISPR